MKAIIHSIYSRIQLLSTAARLVLDAGCRWIPLCLGLDYYGVTGIPPPEWDWVTEFGTRKQIGWSRPIGGRQSLCQSSQKFRAHLFSPCCLTWLIGSLSGGAYQSEPRSRLSCRKCEKRWNEDPSWRGLGAGPWGFHKPMWSIRHPNPSLSAHLLKAMAHKPFLLENPSQIDNPPFPRRTKGPENPWPREWLGVGLKVATQCGPPGRDGARFRSIQ